MHLAFIVFLSSYAGRLALGPIWLVPNAILVAIGTIRGAAWLRSRAAQRAAQPA
jgi:hypothetical protein